MNILNYLWCFVAGLLGILFHLLLKYKKVRERSVAANMAPVTFVEFFKGDLLSTALSFLVVCLALLIIDEAIGLKISVFKVELVKVLKFVFIAVGYMGQSVLSTFLSKTEKQVLRVIDRKTNLADKK